MYERPVLHRDRARALSFGVDPVRYDRSRPTYPDALVDDLLAEAARDVIDVGCGTGIVARLFAARGCSVLGIEPDERMAAFARASLPGSTALAVEVSTFEAWNSRVRTFDLLVSGQAWHWVHPRRGAAKAAEVLRPGGRVGLFWNVAEHEPAARAVLDDVYARLAPVIDAHSMVLGRGTADRFVEASNALDADGSFRPVERRDYRWTKRYSTAEWLDHLPTHSDHGKLPPEDLADLLEAIGEALDASGGGLTVTYTTALLTAVRR